MGLNGAWTQFSIDRNHQVRLSKAIIYKHKWSNFILVHINLLGYVQFSLEQTVQEVPLYHKWLQRVHKPLQVITSTQTSPGYTNLNSPLRSRLKTKRNTLKRENNESSQRFTSQWWIITQWFHTTQNSICYQLQIDNTHSIVHTLILQCIVWCFSLFAYYTSTWNCSSICNFIETSR